MCSTRTRRLAVRPSCCGNEDDSGFGVGGYGEYGERKRGVECVEDGAVPTLASSNPRPARVALFPAVGVE